eukprot:Opistho-2@78016
MVVLPYPHCGLLYIIRPPNVAPIYAPVPLRSVLVEGKVVDMVAEVKVIQEYENRESLPIEATYVFPLDEKSAVFEFTAEVDGRIVNGVVRPKEIARAEYEHAVAQGQSAYLLEESRADVFEVSVGNLQPGKTAKISISYVTELALETDRIKFVLPTAVAPRYSPAGETDPIPSITYSGGKSPYALKLDLLIEMPLGITAVTSPTHAITYKRTNDHLGEASLTFSTTSMDRDLVVLVATPSAHEHRAVFESDGTDTAAMVTLVPRFELDDVKTEIIFVIDRSGSMEGSQIAQAANAMRIFLRSLPPDCYFNIVGFGSSYEFLFKESAKYDDKSMATASTHAQSLQADLGGTELLNPMEAILKRPQIKGYPRQVFVLTDGQISNTDQVISLVTKHSDTTRVFALGIGHSVSRHLVEGLARAGKGTAQFVVDGESMEAKVMRQLKHAIQPALSDVRIDWGESTAPAPAAATAPEATQEPPKRSLLGYRKPSVPKASTVPPPTWSMQAPFTLPPVFDGERFIAYCIFRGVRSAPATVKVVANSPDGPLEAELKVGEDNCFEGNTVHRLAARALIRDLEEDRSYMHKAPGVVTPTSQAVDAEVERLALKYSLASRRTAFVAVDPTRPSDFSLYHCHYGPMQRPVPVASASSNLMYHGLCPSPPGGAMMMKCSAAPPQKKKSGAGLMGMVGSMFGGGGGGALRSTPPSAPSAAPTVQASRSRSAGASAAIDSSFARDMNCAPAPVMMKESCRKEQANVCDDEQEEALCADFSAPPPPPPASFAAAPPMAELAKLSVASANSFSGVISAQKFDGSFNESLLASIGASDASFSAAYATSGATSRDQWLTAVAVVYMEMRLASRKDEWELMANKATKWLRARSGCPDADATLAAARAFVMTL